MVAQGPASCHREGMICVSQGIPSTRKQTSHETQGFPHAKPGSWILGACPVEPVLKGSMARPRSIVSMAHDGWLHPVLKVPAHPEKRSTLWCADPFVEIARVGCGIELGDVQIHHPRGMGAIHHRFDSPFPKSRNDPADREDYAGVAGDMVNEGQPCSWGDFSQECFKDLVGRLDWERNFSDHHQGP